MFCFYWHFWPYSFSITTRGNTGARNNSGLCHWNQYSSTSWFLSTTFHWVFHREPDPGTMSKLPHGSSYHEQIKWSGVALLLLIQWRILHPTLTWDNHLLNKKYIYILNQATLWILHSSRWKLLARQHGRSLDSFVAQHQEGPGFESKSLYRSN